MSDNWSGVLRLGFTNVHPERLQNSLPKYACPDLTNLPGFWGKAVPEMLCQQDNLLYFYVNSSGDVRFGVNCEERECLFGGVDVKKPLYAIFDIYGNTTGIRILNDYRPNANDKVFVRPPSSPNNNHCPVVPQSVQCHRPVRTFTNVNKAIMIDQHQIQQPTSHIK